MPNCRNSSPLFLALVALLICPSMVVAKDKMRFGISGFGGYNTYKMADVNESIDTLNVDPSVLGGSGFALDKIKHGIGLGGGLRAMATKDILVSLDYERLFALSKVEGTIGGESFTMELKSPANAFVLGGAYLFPSASKARLGVGAGVGYYKAAAGAEFSSTSRDSTIDVKGHGIGVHGVGLMDYAATSNIHVEVQAGYRLAKSTNLEVGGVEQLKENGDKMKIDWSGLITRAGITVYFGKEE